MCGIWVSVGASANRRCIEIVAHRGPDGSGFREFTSSAGPVCLGHRRLAVIDTGERGRQPLSVFAPGARLSSVPRFHIVFNGEIFNYLELREVLRARGHRFVTDTDTEVLLRAFIEWDKECLPRLNGMFAFAVWDDAEKRLFAARDRFGVKPLYMRRSGRVLCLASEIKQFSALPERLRVNRTRAVDFLVAGLTDHTAETTFEGIEHVRGGECLSYDLADGASEPRIERWYELPLSGSSPLPEAEARDRYGELLTDAVRLQLRSDVRLGTCLSGGIDSSTIACLAARELASAGSTEAPFTVSAIFDDPQVDEREFIRCVVDATRANAVHVRPETDLVTSRFDDVVFHLDEPFGGTSIFAQWAVFEKAAQVGIKVTLDGQGADEQLGGYQHMIASYERQLRGRIADVTEGTRWARPRPAAPSAAASARPSWLCSDARRATDDTHRSGARKPKSLGEICRFSILEQGLPLLLRYEDRNSMAHGVEARVPFMDHRLVELAVGLGDEHKIFAGISKYILRRAMAGKVPDRILRRKGKIGFSTPEARWIGGPLAGDVRRRALDAASDWPTLLVREHVEELARRVDTSDQPAGLALWRIACFGGWARRFAVGA